MDWRLPHSNLGLWSRRCGTSVPELSHIQLLVARYSFLHSAQIGQPMCEWQGVSGRFVCVERKTMLRVVTEEIRIEIYEDDFGLLPEEFIQLKQWLEESLSDSPDVRMEVATLIEGLWQEEKQKG